MGVLDDTLLQRFFDSLPPVENLTHYASPLESTEIAGSHPFLFFVTLYPLIPTISIAGLSAKAAHIIATSSDPLSMLRELSQNFPKYSNALARRVDDPPQEFLQEATTTRMQLPEGFSGLWLNGLQLQEIQPLRYASGDAGSR